MPEGVRPINRWQGRPLLEETAARHISHPVLRAEEPKVECVGDRPEEVAHPEGSWELVQCVLDDLAWACHGGGLAVGAAVIWHPPCTFIRCCNEDEQGVSSK